MPDDTLDSVDDSASVQAKPEPEISSYRRSSRVAPRLEVEPEPQPAAEVQIRYLGPSGSLNFAGRVLLQEQAQSVSAEQASEIEAWAHAHGHRVERA